MITRKLERFNRTYSRQFVDIHLPHKRNDVSLVLVNSMAFENDGCKFCLEAQRQLARANRTLTCLLKNQQPQETATCEPLWSDEKYAMPGRVYSRPILFTHFPLHRTSDRVCASGRDHADTELAITNKQAKHRPKYDCLSLDATKQVIYINLNAKRFLYYNLNKNSIQVFNTKQKTVARPAQSAHGVQRPHALLLLQRGARGVRVHTRLVQLAKH